MKITKSSQSCLFVETNDKRILVDPSKIEFDVVGTSHCKDINECKEYLKINKKLYLEPELSNISDENAIKMIFKENDKQFHLG